MGDGNSVLWAPKRMADGGSVVLYDDARDQGDLVACAAGITPATVTMMARRARGLLSVVMPVTRAHDLGLQSMPLWRRGGRAVCERTPLMVSVEARDGVSTGISAADRARTIGLIAEPGASARDLVSPGHIFPFTAAAGGLLERAGRLEAAVDLMRLSGLTQVAALCDVLDENGDLAGRPVLEALAGELRVPFLSVSELVEIRYGELWDECGGQRSAVLAA